MAPSKEFTGFIESRISTMNEIIKNLKDEEINLIGICGMGGIGKTTMMYEVIKKVEEENLFHEVAITVVKQQPDPKKIQGDIAEMLGLKLEENNLIVRADRLRQRLLASEDNKRILIILDNVWEDFDLKELGIPLVSGSTGCKILYTSRNRDLWHDVVTKKDIPLQLLSEEEAWRLFREKAGDLADAPDLLQIAKLIVNECGRLPLALVTIGGVLSKKSMGNFIKHAWEDMFHRLTCSSSTPADKRLSSSLELSYTYLEDEGARSLFLLCCLHEEDYDIRIEDLVRYGMGLSLFEGIDEVGKVRHRVFALVDDLKSRSLLLDSEKDECVKVHDVVRDVGISIAARDKFALVSHGLSEWPKKAMYEHCTSISVMSGKMKELPEGLKCPNLEFLLLRCGNLENINCNFFEGMGELKVLELRSNGILQPLESLRNLRTLYLEDYSCEFHNISAIGELLNLEVLSFRESLIRELPETMRKLTKLRLLDVTKCRYLQRIPPGVISGLIRLEELYMRDCSYRNWEGEEGNNDDRRRNASLREFESLIYLNTLEIRIGYDVVLPNIPIFSNLKKYTVLIDDGDPFWNWPIRFQSEKQKQLILSNSLVPVPNPNPIPIPIPPDNGNGGGLNLLIENTECLVLEGEGSNDLVRELLGTGDEGRLQQLQLKILSISECDTSECLAIANTINPNASVFPVLESLSLSHLPNLREIIDHSQIRRASPFGKLSFLEINSCGRLGNLFQLSMVGCLTQLKHLSIKSCWTMEEVISKDDRGDSDPHVASNKIEFPKLESLKLQRLPMLIGFCSKGIDEIEFPQLKELYIENIPELNCLFPNQSVVPSVSEEINIAAFLSLFPQKVAFPNLEVLDVRDCDNLSYIFSPTMTHRIPQLHELTTEESEMMSTSIAGDNGLGEISVHEIEFPRLKGSTLSGLQNLVSFFPEVITTVATSTDDLKNSVQPLFNEKVAFPSLEYLELRGLQKARDIWCSELPTFSFSKLKRIQVEGCGSLGNMFCPSMARGLVNLQELIIKECWTMEAVVDKEEGREDAAQERRIDGNLFPNLRELELKYLLKLRSFCQGTHPLELPLLGEVYIQMCPNMETFSLGRVITPKLQLLYLKYDWVLTDDLNATIRLYQEQQQQEEEEEETLIIRRSRQRIDDDDDGDTDNDDATQH